MEGALALLVLVLRESRRGGHGSAFAPRGVVVSLAPTRRVQGVGIPIGMQVASSY